MEHNDSDGATQGFSGGDALIRKIRVDIGLLDSDSPPEAIAGIIDRIAAAGCIELVRDNLLQTIKQQTKTRLGTLRKQLGAADKQRRSRQDSAAKTQSAKGRPAGLIVDSAGHPLSLEVNAAIMIRHKLGVLIEFDEFAQIPMMMRKPPWERRREIYPRPLTDADEAALLGWVQQQGVHLRGRPAIRTVLAELIHDHTHHPVRDYLDSLTWDGVPRLDHWLITYLGVQKVDNYTIIIGPKWMISAIARIYKPGCIAKYCLLLLGPQDLGKSTALRILGGDWFTDDIGELGTKDSAMQAAGKWIIELAELASTRKAHIDTIKSFVSRPTDRFRPPYGANLVERPRHSVFAGTVNPSPAFLKDDTGNVRFWSATCTKINFDMLRRDRDQLWAEAVHRFKAGEEWWLTAENTIDAAREEQANHSVTIEDNPWFTIIQSWLREEYNICLPENLRDRDKTPCFTMPEILKGALEIPMERMVDNKVTTPVGKIMDKLGWKSSGVRRVGDPGNSVRRWQHKEHTCPVLVQDERCNAILKPPALECPIHGTRRDP